MMSQGLALSDDGRLRCQWARVSARDQDYHDLEWGEPVTGDAELLERISLEGFQAGLSWATVLAKRPAFREVFCGFDPERVAQFTPSTVEALMADARIIRHRGKIEAVIQNARATLAIRETHGSLLTLMAPVFQEALENPRPADWETLRARAHTPESTKLSKLLKGQGFRFIGPTGAYAMLQAIGVVNDHVEGCWCRERTERSRQQWAAILLETRGA